MLLSGILVEWMEDLLFQLKSQGLFRYLPEVFKLFVHMESKDIVHCLSNSSDGCSYIDLLNVKNMKVNYGANTTVFLHHHPISPPRNIL